jgi:hypothetical protein
MKYAIIENGIVINVAEADAEFAAAQGWIECPNAGPGWTYANGVFTEPISDSKPVPTQTKEQLLAQLQELQAQIQALE